MSKSFFLTRQTANLMEDFVRELHADAALFLLYGDEGVGKTRALEELVHTRLRDSTVHWIDLKAGGSGDGALVDSSGMIEQVFAEAKAGDIIIADHFEKALKKSRHQLFLSWSSDGIDKRVSMIIASNTDFFNESRQLAQQYQVRVQSVQQMPLNPDEVVAFLGSYLFPDRPMGNLSIPPLLRNQIALAQGNFGKIIEIAERAGDQITMAPLNETEQIRQGSRVLVGVLIAVVLAIAVAWYFIGMHNPAGGIERVETDDVTTGRVSRTDADADSAAELGESAPALAVGRQDLAELKGRDETWLEAQPEFQAYTGTSLEVEGGGEAESEIVADENPATLPVDTADAAALSLAVDLADDTAATEVDTETEAPDPEAADDRVPQQQQAAEPLQDELVAVADRESPAPVDQTAQMSRLQRDLQSSLEWIIDRNRSIGTLQIMLLSTENFNEEAYYGYVDEVARLGIAERIRIFRTFTGGREVYSVVYGEYESWKAAGDAKGDIPEILRRNSPIPRSVGGLLDEIRRLEGQN